MDEEHDLHFAVECPRCGAESKIDVQMMGPGWELQGGTEVCWKCGQFFVYDGKTRKGRLREDYERNS